MTNVYSANFDKNQSTHFAYFFSICVNTIRKNIQQFETKRRGKLSFILKG